MAFEIRLTRPALQDIGAAVEFISHDSTSAAEKWHTELWEVIYSLQEMPFRFGVIPETSELEYPYRSALHYSHRIVYRVDEPAEIVYVVRVYHGARRPLSPKDVI